MIDAVNPIHASENRSVADLSDSDAGPGREVYYALPREKVRKNEISGGVKGTLTSWFSELIL